MTITVSFDSNSLAPHIVVAQGTESSKRTVLQNGDMNTSTTKHIHAPNVSASSP